MATQQHSRPFLMKANSNNLNRENHENPDVTFRRAGPNIYIDLFFLKPNKYRLSENNSILTQSEQWANSNYLTLARSVKKAAPASNLLLSGPKKRH